MGGNSKRKARRRLDRLRAEWDIIATKCLLLTPDGSKLFTYGAADKVLTTLFNRRPTQGDRTRLYDALERAGVKAYPFTHAAYRAAGAKLWSGSGNFQNIPKADFAEKSWTSVYGSTSDSASESSTSSDTSTPSALGSPSLPDGNSRSAVKVGGF